MTSFSDRIKGVGVRRNLPPPYNFKASHVDNFDSFFNWAVDLRNPMRQVPEIAETLGYGIRRHPIGFIAVYLSERDKGVDTPYVSGIARANIYPPGDPMREDIHCHGFDFRSGSAAGTLLNTRFFPDFSVVLPEGEGYIGYETRVDAHGINHTVQATDAVIPVPRSELEIVGPGDVYDMKAREDFHTVSAGDEGALTIFCKTPAQGEPEGLSLVLRPPTDAPPGSY